MGQLLTANSATNLYWLGRYIERISGLLTQIMPAYDKCIDIDTDAGKKLYKGYSVEIKYDTAHEFLKEAMFGDHTSNVAKLASYARENAIISRTYINTEAFGEVIELHSMLQNASNSYVDLDYKLINDALSLISEIWGEVSKISKSTISDHFLKLGRLIERLDFHLRFHGEDEHSAIITENIENLIAVLSTEEKPMTKQTQTQTEDESNIIDIMHSQVEALIIS